MTDTMTSQNIVLFSWDTLYTGCTGRNVENFESVFLILKYTDITRNTYIQSLTVTEILAKEF
jgi:hypothetical protein